MNNFLMLLNDVIVGSINSRLLILLFLRHQNSIFKLLILMEILIAITRNETENFRFSNAIFIGFCNLNQYLNWNLSPEILKNKTCE